MWDLIADPDHCLSFFTKTRCALPCKTNISDDAAKKCDKCKQMHYIEKNYVTLYTCVTMEKNEPFFV